MMRFPAPATLTGAAVLFLAFSASARDLRIPAIDSISDLACAHDAGLLKWALGTLALPVIASALANFRKRLPPRVANAIDVLALNFVKAAAKSAPMIVLAACLDLAACSSAENAAVVGFEATALKGARSAEDNNILLWRTDACGTPFSAVVRNAQTVPGLVPALSALCVPNPDKGNPDDLLKSVPSKP